MCVRVFVLQSFSLHLCSTIRFYCAINSIKLSISHHNLNGLTVTEPFHGNCVQIFRCISKWNFIAFIKCSMLYTLFMTCFRKTISTAHKDSTKYIPSPFDANARERAGQTQRGNLIKIIKCIPEFT